MRRGTAITLILLFALLLAVALIQLSQDPPSSPYPGPEGGTELPSATPSV